MEPVEVKKSKGGQDYSVAILRDGPKVVSRAVLVSIQHDTKPPELTLKISRHKKVKGTFGMPNEVLESDAPKSELTLSGEETSTLIKYLETNAGLVIHDAGTYLKVDGEKDIKALVVETAKRFASADQTTLLKLAKEQKLLPDDVLDMAIVKARQDALVEFKSLLDTDATEAKFQKWFEVNDWALGSDCAVILDERDVDVSNIADYLVQAYDGHVDIVEIKRSSLGFWADAKDHNNWVPHSDLIKAIIQAQNYQFELEREMNSVKLQERIGHYPIAKPRALLIHGRSEGWSNERFRAQRLLNGGMTSIQVLTYDQVYARAEKLANDL